MKQRIRVYDSGDAYIDRYTVVFMDLDEGSYGFSALAMSAHPFSPQGFGQHTTAMPGKHLGKRIKFSDLPADCQRMVRDDLKSLAISVGSRPMGF